MRPTAAVPLLAAALAVARIARGDAYDATLERSRALEQGAQYAAGADLLAGACAAYPQDYVLTLRLGWLSFLAGRNEAAERAYREAVLLSDGKSAEARSGLGWSLLRLGDKQQAARELRAALDLDPRDATAAEGLALAEIPDPPAVELFPAFAVTGHVYPSHPYKSVAGTATVGASVLLVRHLLVGATYRGSLFAFEPSPDQPRRGASTFTQHEGYVSAGYVAPRAAALGQYAFVDDLSGFSGVSHHVGGTLRYSPWGDGVLSGSYSRYSDMDVGRGEVSWRVPLGEHFWVRPAGALQLVPDETLVTGYATLGYDGPRFGAWAGGKLGDEVRPAYLSAPFILNVPERVVYGAWGGARISLGNRWLASLSTEVHVLERTDGLTPSTTPATFVTLAIARAL